MLLPPMLETFRYLRDQGRVFEAAVAVSGSVPPHLYRQAEETAGVLCTGSVRNALSGSSAAMVCSGTATLETAMWGTPFIVAYRTSAITYLLARLLVRGVKNIGMANIVAGEQFAREYIQGDASPLEMAQGLLPLLSDTEERRRILEGTEAVRRALGPPGGSARAAKHILREYHEIS